MKKIIVITLLLLFSSNIFAQKHEIGLFLGGANAISDIGKTDWINLSPRRVNNSDKLQIPLVFGLIYRYNLNPQQSLRFNLSLASIGDDNIHAEEPYRKHLINYYENTILELSTVFEYNFFPINAEQQNAHSPYIFAGIGMFGANKYTYKIEQDLENDEGPAKWDKDMAFDLSIPFGIGYKYKMNWNWIIAAEVGFRPTFIDYLDKGIIKDEDLSFVGRGFEDIEEKRKIIKQYTAEIGDNRKNDWYVFTGLTLTYTFGRPACFCD